MDRKDWEKAKERLSLPLGSVKLIADGYTVTLQRVPVKDMFHNASHRYCCYLCRCYYIYADPAGHGAGDRSGK